MADLYQWRVIFHDGTSTTEYDDARPDGRGFAEREDKPVKALLLDDHYSVSIPAGAAPVFFRRRTIEMHEEGQRIGSVTHCIGWKRDESAAVYLFVFEDGSTLLTDDVQAV
jgi:hypothetical protein